ncbi:MAG: hypothetical protein AAF847_11510 [Bacteroidota bacterium]
MKQIILIILSAFHITAICQDQNIVTDSLNRDAYPIGGLDRVALEYYKIDFTKQQRALLENQSIVFIYWIEINGVPTLENINGIEDPAILDSLIARTAFIPNFQPQLQNGTPVPSIYMMQITFPTYRFTEQQLGYRAAQAYRAADIDEFEYINKSGIRLDLLFGGLVNQPTFNAAEYLKTGGGAKMDIILFFKPLTGIGLNMTFYANGLKQDFPINSTREQFSTPLSLLMGFNYNKILKTNAKNEWQLQLEANLAIQNLTKRLDSDDTEWTQLRGFSPGVLLHYTMRFGKEKTNYYYGKPSIFSNYINIHLGVRPLLLDLKEASGVLMEMGVAYRWGIHHVDAYRLK